MVNYNLEAGDDRGGSEPLLKQVVTQTRAEREVDGSPLQISHTLMETAIVVGGPPWTACTITPWREPIPPTEILLSHSRKYCATCMKRKTVWLFSYGQFCKHTRCWKCMTPRERSEFRAGY